MNNSSLQLVEMCSSSRKWSPVCDKNWTLQDALVVCSQLDNQGLLQLASLCLVSYILMTYYKNILALT